MTGARDPGRLLVSSSPPFPSGAEGQVIAFAERGLGKEGAFRIEVSKSWNEQFFKYLEDLADLGVEAVEEEREGDDGSRADDVCDRVFGRGRL